MRIGLAVSATVLCLAAVGVLGTTGGRHKVQQFKDKNASGGEMRSPFQNVFAHLNQEFYLTVNGKTFRDVRGTVPFYLEVPQLHSIVFVTGKMDCPSIFHVYDLQSKQEKTVESGPIGFGWDMGGTNKPGAPWTVYVLKATTNEITMAWQGDKGRDLIGTKAGLRHGGDESVRNPSIFGLFRVFQPFQPFRGHPLAMGVMPMKAT